MTTDGGSAGTAADGYKVDPPPIPRPRETEDPAEPGRRREIAGAPAGRR